MNLRTEPRSLTDMIDRPTSYEVVLIYKGTTKRIGFSERKTRSALLNMARAANVADMLDAADLDTKCSYAKDFGWKFGSATVCFGQTERQLAEVE